MSLLRRKLFCLTGAALCSFWLQAQPRTNFATAGVPGKSPVANFRELLAMSPKDRGTAIAARWPGKQKAILDKLEQYEMLPSDLREQRLRETELRWYLLPLMDEAPTNRAAHLALVPKEELPLVQERLQIWDIIPPSLKTQWKNDDMVADYFAQIQAEPDNREVILSTVPRPRRAELEKELNRWQNMSPVDRQKALSGMKIIFELPPAEQEETLDTVSDEEREQMKKTLDAYKKLTPAQRQQCIHSFEKFAAMRPAERNEFLRNAERWTEMTPAEREKWRQLVDVAPIMPPPDTPPPKLPSHSERLAPPPVRAAVATN